MKIKNFLRKTIYKRVAAYLLVLGMVMSDLPLEVLAAGDADETSAEYYEVALNVPQEPENVEMDSVSYTVEATNDGVDDIQVLSEDDIASGTYENITWSIDSNGKLTVEGTGEFSASTHFTRAPWWSKNYEIKTAVVRVMGLQNASCMFYGCSHLTSVDMSGFDTSSVTDMSGMFYSCFSLTSVDVSGFDTSSVTDMSCMFQHCNSLTSVDMSGFDTSSVTDMSYMFGACGSLTSVDVSNFDTSRVTDMRFMFANCDSLRSVDMSGFDTSHVTDMSSMFYECDSLRSVDMSGFDTSRVTDMSWMFGNCESLTSLDVSGFDTSSITYMGYMFYGCDSITQLRMFPNLQVQNVKLPVRMHDNSGNVYDFCPVGLKEGIILYVEEAPQNIKWSIDADGKLMVEGTGEFSVLLSERRVPWYSQRQEIKTAVVRVTGLQNASYMFCGCYNLTSVDVSGFDTSSVTDMSGMFYSCESLTSLDLSSFDMSNVIDAGDMFLWSDNLVTLYTPYGVKKGMSIDFPIDISDENNNEWYDVSGNTYTTLPEGLDYSILLTRGAKPDAVQEELIVNLLKKTYEQGSEINPKDLRIKYRQTDGRTIMLSLKETAGANNGYTLSAVDMNTLGENNITVSYNNGTMVLSKDVSFTVVEKSVGPTKPGGEGSHAGSDKPNEEGSHAGSDKPDEEGSHEGSDTPTKATGLQVSFPSGKTFTYTGSSIKPEIVVTYNEETLTEGVDYTVKCSNNTKAGTAKLTVTGKGRFTGKQVSEFTITRKSLKDEDIAVGSLIVAENSKAVPIIYYNGMKLGSKDYTLEGDTGKLALGAASPSVKVTGQGNYKDDITIKIKVVAKSDLKKFAVTLGKEKLVYNGKPQQATINIVDKGNPEKKFTEGTDYKLLFNNSHTNAGTVKVTVIGLGEYSGAVTKSYKIQPRKAGEADVTVTGLKQSYAYTSSGVTFNQSAGKLTVKYADTVSGMKADLVEGKDYKISYSANKKAGTAKYTISFIGNYKGSKAKKGTFTITSATLNDNTVGVVVPDKVYTGKKNAYKSVPIVVDQDGNVLKKSDYTVNYYADAAFTKEIKGKDNLIELGDSQKEADVYVKITGKGNYAGNTSAYAKGTYKVKKTAENVFDLSKAKVTFKQDGKLSRSWSTLDFQSSQR